METTVVSLNHEQAELPWHRLIGVTIMAFGLGVSVNVLEPAMLGHQIIRFAPAWKNTALGLTTFLGLLVAVVTQPLVGALSDRTSSRLGRRAPYLIGGALLAVVSHFLIAYAPSLAVLAFSVLVLQAASNTAHGPFLALIPDQIPSSQRGRAAGLKSTFDILSFIVGRQAGGILIAQERLTAAASVAGAAILIALALTLLVSKDRSGAASDREIVSLASVFRVPWRQRPNFSLWFLNRTLFWGSLLAINTFILFYLVDVVGMAESSAQRLVGNVAAIIGGAVLLTALPAGWLSDRVGRRMVIAVSGLVAAAGVGMLLLTPTPTGVVTAAGVIGLGTGVYLSGSWALATDLVPTEEAGRYMGIANIASAGGSAAARGIGAVIVDPINQLLGSQAAGYTVLFVGAMLALLLASILILRLQPRPDGSYRAAT